MKTKTYLIVILFGAVLFSCKKDVYYSFTEEEKSLIIYNEMQIISFLNLTNLDTLVYSITSKEEYFESDIDYILSRKIYHQLIKVKLESEKGDGEIFYGKGPKFIDFEIGLRQNDKILFAGYFAGSMADSIIVRDDIYRDLYVFIEPDSKIKDTLFYSSKKGIVKFASSESIAVYAIIE